MVGKSRAKEGPGQALIKQRGRAAKQQQGSRAGGGEGRQVLESITHITDLEEVLEQAEHAGRIFSALNPLPEVLISADSDGEFAKLSGDDKKMQQRLEEAVHQSSLTVPRRPKWHVGMTVEELDVQERQAFLTWRRQLAGLEENEKLVITPFEKNLDIWRQLWRVIERSNVVVMVVDARNPLFYRCPDLEAYVSEVNDNKSTILLLNKADLVPLPIRRKWAEYFKSQGVKFLFWSAKDASSLLENNTHVPSQLKVLVEGNLEQIDSNNLEDDSRILGRDELLSRLQFEAESLIAKPEESTSAFGNLTLNSRSRSQQSRQQAENNDESAGELSSERESSQMISKHAAVGFVGYPNVGKSSTINALVGGKRTGVTATPGKTKHFQTFIINEKLIICDCPGLVFPSFTSSKSEMVASGVLPIDRMTDYKGPIQVILKEVPRDIIEKTYGILLPSPKPYEPQGRPPAAAEFLRVYALSRGHVISSGLPDESRAARQVLKDFVNGKLLYCHSPPEEDTPLSSEHNSIEGSEQSNFSDGFEEEGSVNLESKVEENTSESSQLVIDQNEVVSAVDQELPEALGSSVDEQILSRAGDSLSKLDGMFEIVDAPSAREVSHIRPRSLHKMQKKAPRKKDRSWRAGNDNSNKMPAAKFVSKPVSHGAADLVQITT